MVSAMIDPATYRAYYENEAYVLDARGFALEEKNERLKVLLPFLRQAAAVLEIGCGAGVMGDCHPNYTGVDISEVAVRLARGRGARVVAADVRCIPFPDRSFDLIFSYNVLEHIPDPERVLKEVDRLLTPGGTAILKDAFNCEKTPNQWIRQWKYCKLGLRRLYREWFQRGEGLDYKPIVPDYTVVGGDFDAVASIDAHAVFKWFRFRGYRALNERRAPLLGQMYLFTNHPGYVMARKGS